MHVELQEIAVELVLLKVQQVVGLAPDVLHDIVKTFQQRRQAGDVCVLQQNARQKI